MLKHFEVDPSRSKLVVDTKYYQMDAMYALERARIAEPTLLQDTDKLPSWSKAAADVLKAQGFWTTIFQAMLLGKHNLSALNISYQTGEVSRVTMAFLPGSMRNAELNKLIKIMERALPNWIIIGLFGDAEIYNVKVKNKNSEAIAKKKVENANGKPVLILSKGMASRSFSVKEITNILLCYDGGEAGATNQKYSRGLTPDGVDKVAHIISLSFDPNRDDRFDDDFMIAATKHAKKNDGEIGNSLLKVLQTIDLLSCTDDGSVKIDLDNYLPQLLARDSASRLLGRQTVMGLLHDDEIEALANGNTNYSELPSQEVAPKGKTFNGKKSRTEPINKKSKENDTIEKARRAIVTVANHMVDLSDMTNKTTVKEILQECISKDAYRKYFMTEFKIHPQLILNLFERGAINYEFVSLNTLVKKTQYAATY